MRVELIKATYHEQARKQAPWATVISEVPGGYMAFESYVEFNVWKKEKRRRGATQHNTEHN